MVDTDTRDTMSSGLQHSEGFTFLTPFVGRIKIEHFSFLRRLVNFDSHCIIVKVFISAANLEPFSMLYLLALISVCD